MAEIALLHAAKGHFQRVREANGRVNLEIIFLQTKPNLYIGLAAFGGNRSLKFGHFKTHQNPGIALH